MGRSAAIPSLSRSGCPPEHWRNRVSLFPIAGTGVLETITRRRDEVHAVYVPRPERPA